MGEEVPPYQKLSIFLHPSLGDGNNWFPECIYKFFAFDQEKIWLDIDLFLRNLKHAAIGIQKDTRAEGFANLKMEDFS